MHRPLGSCEKLAYYTEHHYPGNFTVVAHLTRVDQENFNKAIHYAFSQHPLLSAKILPRDNNFNFQFSDQSHKVTIQHLYEKANVEDIIGKSLANKFDPLNSPFIKVICIHNSAESTVLFTFYHVIADGVAGIHFLEQVLHFYDAIKDSHPIETHFYPLRDPIEQLLNLEKKGALFLNLNELTFTENFVNSSRIGIEYYQLPIESTTQLLSRCHSLEVTVHHYISAVAALALKKIFGEISEELLSVISPVNLRKHLILNILPCEFGYYLGRTDINLLMTELSDVNILAKKFKFEAEKQLTKDYLLMVIEILGEMTNTITQTKDIASLLSGEKPTILISNLGNIDNVFQTYRHCTLFNVSMFVSPQTIPHNKNNYLIALATYQGKMNMTISYDKSVTSEQNAHEFMRYVLNALH